MTTALAYPERMNALNGEPGGGKTWVALLACAQAIRKGLHVIFIDLEDHASSTVARLLALGCTRQQILEFFHYVRPGCAMEPEHMGFLLRMIAELDVQLVVIDSIGELMAMQGVKPNDDDAVARLYRAIPRRLADAGPGVLLLDHVPKNNEHAPLFGIGSQRKKAAIDGSAFMVETVKAFAAGTDGKLALRTAKDRNGNFVVGHVAAEITVTPDGDGGLSMVPRAPAMAGSHQRQTTNMRRVSDWLQAAPDASGSRADIARGSGVHDRHLSVVLGDLVDEGWAIKYPGGRGKADRYCLVRPFDELEPTPNSGDSGDEF